MVTTMREVVVVMMTAVAWIVAAVFVVLDLMMITPHHPRKCLMLRQHWIEPVPHLLRNDDDVVGSKCDYHCYLPCHRRVTSQRLPPR